MRLRRLRQLRSLHQKPDLALIIIQGGVSDVRPAGLRLHQPHRPCLQGELPLQHPPGQARHAREGALLQRGTGNHLNHPYCHRYFGPTNFDIKFLAGNCLSWADLMLVNLADNLKSPKIGGAPCLEKCPKLSDLCCRCPSSTFLWI